MEAGQPASARKLALTGEEAIAVNDAADPDPTEVEPQPADAGSGRKDPESIRQQIEATKDRISDSVEALAEIKADIDYAKTHPGKVAKEKVAGAKDEIVSRLSEKRHELMARRRAGGGGRNDFLAKAFQAISRAYRVLEKKLDEVLGVDVDRQ